MKANSLEPLFLNAEKLRGLLTPERLFSSLREALIQLSERKAHHSPRYVLGIRSGLFGMMAGEGRDFLGAKMVCVLPGNSTRDINPHQGIVALFDPATGECLALGEGSTITALRTAAISAIATDALAKEESAVLTVVGSGLQAQLHAEMICRIRPIRELRIIARTKGKAESLARKIKEGNPSLRKVTAETSLIQAMQGAHILCLCTSAESPYLSSDDLPDGIHVNAIGACRPGQKEVELRRGDDRLQIYVESLRAASEEAEELKSFMDSSASDFSEITEIGALLSKERIRRSEGKKITLFKSVGIGLSDAAVLNIAYKSYRRSHVLFS